jgi:Leucine-rich repeat (LRR) protein
MDSLPNPNNQVPADRLSLYAVQNVRNVHQIKSHQFLGYRTKEIRIEYMEALHLEDRAFEGVQELETLKLTHNNFGEMGQPDLIFAGLVNLTTLDLSYNQITGWKSAGTIYVNLLQLLIIKLKSLEICVHLFCSVSFYLFIFYSKSIY